MFMTPQKKSQEKKNQEISHSGFRFYLGIDSGGTHTRAMLADETGRIWGTGYAGSANPNHHSRQQIVDSLQCAIREAARSLPQSQTLEGVFLGSSGLSTAADCDAMCLLLRSIEEIGQTVQVDVQNDTVIGLTGGLTGRPGLALIAGTGSACFGINAQRQSFLCGGWGAIADDIGSAPWIGTCAVRAAVWAEDGRGAKTLLSDLVFDDLKLTEPRQLIHRLHNQNLARADLGRLAPLVIEAYQAGDAAAQEIVQKAIQGLTKLVSTTQARLFADSDCEMILVGGLALSGPPFQPLLIEAIQAAVPSLHVRGPELSPVQGAVLEAMRAGGVAWNEPIFANLRRERSLNLEEGQAHG